VFFGRKKALVLQRLRSLSKENQGVGLNSKNWGLRIEN